MKKFRLRFLADLNRECLTSFPTESAKKLTGGVICQIARQILGGKCFSWPLLLRPCLSSSFDHLKRKVIASI